jgi:hypothetical protein
MGGCGAMSVAGLLNDYPYEKLGEGHLVDVAGGMGAMSVSRFYILVACS